MEITIRHTPGCPNLAVAEARLNAVLAESGITDAAISREVVSTAEEAQSSGFTGSPTILVDGRDPFADPGAEPALACRRYDTPNGPDGAPTVEQLRSAIGVR